MFNWDCNAFLIATANLFEFKQCSWIANKSCNSLINISLKSFDYSIVTIMYLSEVLDFKDFSL
jgi:hypothetical protein